MNISGNIRIEEHIRKNYPVEGSAPVPMGPPAQEDLAMLPHDRHNPNISDFNGV